jgi:hypothetical protein
MKIAIVGSRDFRHMDFASDIIHSMLIMCIPEAPTENEICLVSGGARGIDSLAESIADKLKIEKQIFIPDWDKYGKKAGFLRNSLIVKEANYLVAFWDGKSKGTKHSIDLAIAKKIPVNIYVRG